MVQNIEDVIQRGDALKCNVYYLSAKSIWNKNSIIETRISRITGDSLKSKFYWFFIGLSYVSRKNQ